MVFCNGAGKLANGGSCFIGQNSWDDEKERKKKGIEKETANIYHGVFPGIYRQTSDMPGRGGLGRNEQALLVCDLFPDMDKRQPNPESMKSALELVAHIPILEESIYGDDCIKACKYKDKSFLCKKIQEQQEESRKKSFELMKQIYESLAQFEKGALDKRLEDIREGISIPRNRALVYALTYMNIMEHWGSGIPRIIRRCKELGMEEPELKEIAGCFRISLFRFSDKTRIGKSTDKAIESTDKVRKSADKVRISTDKVKDNQKKIIQYIEERGAITNKEVQNLLNVKDSRALKVLKEMVESGILKKEGKLRGSYYKLK